MAMPKATSRAGCRPPWDRTRSSPTLRNMPSAAAKTGSIPGVRTPITLNGHRAAAERPSPRLGEHTEEILREIGEN